MGWNLSNKKRKTLLNRKGISNTNICAKNDNQEKLNTESSSIVKNEKTNLETSKKIWSFEAIVEAMKPSSEELQYRKEKSQNVDLQQYSKSFSCTKCNKNLKLNSDESDKIHVHPCLGVLMCQNCCNYYEDGEFSLDSEGEDKYCRWCGEGGTIFGCSLCICGFCMTCIRKHFGFEYFKKVQKDDDWLCFFCYPKPLWDKRYICFLALQASESKSFDMNPETSKIENKKKDAGYENHKKGLKKQNNHTMNPLKTLYTNSTLEQNDSDSSTDFESWGSKAVLKDKGKKRLYSSSSDEAEVESPEKKIKKLKFSKKEFKKSSQNNENLKQLVVEKLQRILKLSEYQMVIGVNWSSKMLKKLADPKQITSENLKDECEKIKWFLSILSSYLVEFCNSVDSVEKSLSVPVETDGSNNVCQQVTEPTGFSSVMQFLNFTTNQVKTFMKKGLTLQDIVEADIYDDNKFIGIKKKSPSRTLNEDSSNNEAHQTVELNFENHKDASQSTEVEKDESLENSSKLVIDQEAEVQEVDGDVTDISTPSAAAADTKSPSGSKEDILKILEILENA